MISKRTSELERKAMELKEEGRTYRQIAPLLGVSHSTVRRWLDDDYRKRQIAYATAYIRADRNAKKAERQKRLARIGRLIRSQIPTLEAAE